MNFPRIIEKHDPCTQGSPTDCKRCTETGRVGPRCCAQCSGTGQRCLRDALHGKWLCSAHNAICGKMRVALNDLERSLDQSMPGLLQYATSRTMSPYNCRLLFCRVYRATWKCWHGRFWNAKNSHDYATGACSRQTRAMPCASREWNI